MTFIHNANSFRPAISIMMSIRILILFLMKDDVRFDLAEIKKIDGTMELIHLFKLPF